MNVSFRPQDGGGQGGNWARQPFVGTPLVLYACTATDWAAPAAPTSRALCRNVRVALVHSLSPAVRPSHVPRYSAAEQVSTLDHWGMASVSQSLSRVTWVFVRGVRSTMWHFGMPKCRLVNMARTLKQMAQLPQACEVR